MKTWDAPRMKKYGSGINPSQIRLVEVPPPSPEPPDAWSAAVAESAMPGRGTAVGAVKRMPSDGRRETSRGGWNRKRMVLAAGVLGSLVVVAGLVAVLWLRAPAHNVGVTRPTPAGAKPGTPPAATLSANKASTQDGDTEHEDAATKMQALKSAGNWNVFVIYAVEWTRRQPENGEAWRELSTGYLKLGQFGEALTAATKAVQFAPGDSQAWQNLGQANLATQESEAALVAFEKAASLNERDVVSLAQAGTLQAQLGRLPEAKATFGKALAVSPDDTDALCGAASVAQKEGRLQDAAAMTHQIESHNGHCRDPNPGQRVRVPVSGPVRSEGAATDR